MARPATGSGEPWPRLTMQEAAERAGFHDFMLAPGGGIRTWDRGYWREGFGTYLTPAAVYGLAAARPVVGPRRPLRGGL